MIRDLRSGPPQTAPPQSDSLAFARIHVANASTASVAANTVGAFTIAVTAPRMHTCKRGVAANLAAHLALTRARAGASVCVIDIDLECREIGLRFNVARPTLLDIANNAAVRDDKEQLIATIARIDPPGLSVVPVQPPSGPLLPLLHTKAVTMLDRLRAAFDYVIIDAPVAFGASGAVWEAAILERADALLVAVSAEASAFGSALRYLNTVGAMKHSGALSSIFDTHLVLTGSEEDGSRSLLTERALDRTLRGVPVIGSIPQLWGRKRPDAALVFDMDSRLHDEFASIMTALTGIK